MRLCTTARCSSAHHMGLVTRTSLATRSPACGLRRKAETRRGTFPRTLAPQGLREAGPPRILCGNTWIMEVTWEVCGEPGFPQPFSRKSPWPHHTCGSSLPPPELIIWGS